MKKKVYDLKPLAFSPRVMQPFDVDIEVTHCGVCHTDLAFINDEWGMTKYPIVPGHEAIGKVIALGKDVKEFKMGDRVGVSPCVGGCMTCEDCVNEETNLCPKQVWCYGGVDNTGATTYGGYANRMRVDSRFIYAIPDKLPGETAAPLLCAGATVFSPLRKYVKPKQLVGIIGIGGLGHLAIQFSRALGYETIAFSTSANKEKEAKEFGAEHFVDSSKKEQMEKWNRKIDFILSTVSANLDWEQYISLLRPDGRLCFVGIPEGNIAKFNIMGLMYKRISVCASPLGSKQDFLDMLKLAADKHIVAKTELFKFSDVAKALARVKDNTIRYRGVLVADEKVVEAANKAAEAAEQKDQASAKRAKK